MKNKIGELAGKVWQTLNNKGEVKVSDLPKLLGENPPLANQALGWLAREDKVVFRTKGSTTYVSLSEHEK